MSRQTQDLVIAGGGPAGAAAACLLARAGRAPLVLEREAGPRHKICGEFLSIEAQTCLADLGIDVRALGGSSIRTVRLVHGGAVAQARLPFEGIGLTRRSLDEALLRRAEALGAEVLRGCGLREVIPQGERLRLSLGGGDGIEAHTLFLATGKHDVRGARRPAAATDNDLIGFKTYLALSPDQHDELRGAVEVMLFQDGYAGLQLVEEGMANLCLLARRDLFDRVGKSWQALLDHLTAECPHLELRLAGALPLLDRPLTIFQVPYGFVHRSCPADPEGLFRLGDQAGVIPSFSGDGLSIALHTGRLAAATVLAGGSASVFHGQVRSDIAGQIRLASRLYRASRAPLARRAFLQICRTFPGTLRAAAAWTRVPDAALRRTGLAVGRASAVAP